jgi:hypothetical protein
MFHLVCALICFSRGRVCGFLGGVLGGMPGFLGSMLDGVTRILGRIFGAVARAFHVMRKAILGYNSRYAHAKYGAEKQCTEQLFLHNVFPVREIQKRV